MAAKQTDLREKGIGVTRAIMFGCAVIAIELALIFDCVLCFSHRNQAQRSLIQAESYASSLAHDVNALTVQDANIRQSSRFCFDRAVDARARARNLDTDDADQVAIDKFDDCARGFPNDLLAVASVQAAMELKGDLTKRDEKTTATQNEVTRLIQVCRDNTLAKQQITRNRTPRFTPWGELDYQDGVATMDAEHPYVMAAYGAKKDPGYTLHTGSDTCDGPQ